MESSLHPAALLSRQAFSVSLSKGIPLTTPSPRPGQVGGLGDWIATLRSFTHFPATSSLAQRLNDRKINLVKIMNSPEGTPLLLVERQIEAVDAYATELYILQESLLHPISIPSSTLANSSDPELVARLDRDLLFDWRLYLHSGDSVKGDQLPFELTMITHLKAALIYNRARILWEQSGDVNIPEIGRLLSKAASIYELLENKLSFTSDNGGSQWQCKVQRSSGRDNPAEMSPYVCGGLAKYCRALAQSIQMVKVFVSNPAPSSVLVLKSKLSEAASKLFAESVESLVHSAPATLPRGFYFNLELLNTAAGSRELLLSLARFQWAKHLYEREDNKQVGVALACCNIARSHAVEQKGTLFSHESSGVPAHMRELSNLLLHLIDELHSSAERDNKMIFFESVPRSEADLQALAAGVAPPGEHRLVIAATADEPEVTGRSVPLQLAPLASGILGVFGFRSASTGTGPEAASVSSAVGGAQSSGGGGGGMAVWSPPDTSTAAQITMGAPVGGVQSSAPSMSDEEFARELERRLKGST